MGNRVADHGITIDLAGFTLRGDADPLSGVGIFVVGFDDVAVVNDIRRFFRGLRSESR